MHCNLEAITITVMPDRPKPQEDYDESKVQFHYLFAKTKSNERLNSIAHKSGIRKTHLFVLCCCEQRWFSNFMSSGTFVT